MDGFQAVRKLRDIEPGEMVLVYLAGEMILLANVGGTFHAVSAKCTHQGALLSYGTLLGREIVCPVHFACFDVTTGKSNDGLGYEDLKRYTVKVKGDDVLIGPLDLK